MWCTVSCRGGCAVNWAISSGYHNGRSSWGRIGFATGGCVSDLHIARIKSTVYRHQRGRFDRFIFAFEGFFKSTDVVAGRVPDDGEAFPNFRVLFSKSFDAAEGYDALFFGAAGAVRTEGFWKDTCEWII